MTRPLTPCTRCGHPTRAESGVCRSCQNFLASLTQETGIALTDGHWQVQRGIQVWVETPKPTRRRKVMQHGTVGAYRRHLRENTPPCKPCVEAQRLTRAEDRRKALEAAYARATEFQRLAIDTIRYGKSESEAA